MNTIENNLNKNTNNMEEKTMKEEKIMTEAANQTTEQDNDTNYSIEYTSPVIKE